jgi:hypothetical protein
MTHPQCSAGSELPEAGPSNWRELEGAKLPDVKSGVKPPFHFRRYVNGVEMAEDVEISNASTVREGFAKARALYGTPRGMDLVLTINEPQTVKVTDAQINDVIVEFARQRGPSIGLTFLSGSGKHPKATGSAINLAKDILALSRPQRGD